MAVSVAPWVVAADVAQDDRVKTLSLPPAVTLDMICQAATDFLFQRSGERFPGVRTDTIRPHRILGNTLGSPFYNGSGLAGWYDRSFPQGIWSSANFVGPEFKLPGQPVVAVTTIVVDGVTLDPSLYRVEAGGTILRLQDPATGAFLGWPSAQNIAAPIGSVGTWSITYTHGQTVPQLGFFACRELAIELALKLASQDTRTPERVTRIQRGGLDIEMVNATDIFKDGRTGLFWVDAFINAYDSAKKRKRATVFSPDMMESVRN